MAKSSEHGPSYYKRGHVETWDFIRQQGLSFHLGNAIKYIVRAGYKESKIKDLSKAIHYLQNELEHTINHTTTASERVQKELSDWEFEYPEGPGPTAGSNSRRIQRVLERRE